MKRTSFKQQGWGVALAAVLAAATGGAQAQQRPGGTTGGGFPGGFGGFGGGGATTSRSGTTTYPNNTQVGEAMITSDPETRKLIIVTDDDTNENIRRVIMDLDRPKPQVLIKVVFLQVTHDNDLDFGVEGSYSHRIKRNTTGTGSTQFGLEDAASMLAGGGLYKILGDDLEVTIRALATAGKTEVLSRPSILARNNQQATIVVGQEVPFITNTRFDAVNGQINTVTYQDIGIILRVTPFISSDGMVEMIVQPEISSISADRVNIGGGVEASVIDKRSADTVVVTPNGQTVAIGGLIGTQRTINDRKVPLLGDIPLLGYAFKRKVTSDTKTELLIFLTPYVVQQPGDLARMTEDEAARLERAPKVFTEKDLNRILEGVPAKPAKPGAATGDKNGR
jgi:general secretion pathway protein D